MSDIKQREEKIKEKRKQTPFRDYIKEIASRTPLVFHKNNGLVSKYPPVGRLGKVIPNKDYQEQRDTFANR